jgi:hypothetical protein
VPTGEVSRLDQDGSRCANGEVALKFVVKVNPAQEIKTLCVMVSYLIFLGRFWRAWLFANRELTIAIQMWIHLLVRNLNITVPSGGNIPGYCVLFCCTRSFSVVRGPYSNGWPGGAFFGDGVVRRWG